MGDDVKIQETRTYGTTEGGEAAEPDEKKDGEDAGDGETKSDPDDTGTYQGTEHE